MVVGGGGAGMLCGVIAVGVGVEAELRGAGVGGADFCALILTAGCGATAAVGSVLVATFESMSGFGRVESISVAKSEGVESFSGFFEGSGPA